MEEKSNSITGLVKFLGWVFLIDVFTIAVAGVYFLAGGKGDFHDFGETVITAGVVVSVIGVFIVGISHDNPRTASKLYTIRKASQSYFQENRVKKFFSEQKKMAKARLIVILAGLSIILMGFGSLQFGYSPEELRKVDEFRKVEVLSTKEIYPSARKIALGWSIKYQLISTHVPIIGPNNRWEEKDIIFTFISTEYPNVYLWVKCTDSHCSKTTTKSGLSYLLPIEFEKIQIDSIEAAQIGLENGGNKKIYQAFGTGHMSLERDINGTLRWAVSFDCEDCLRSYVYINPYTGELIEK
jgi:hypothetical protein